MSAQKHVIDGLLVLLDVIGLVGRDPVDCQRRPVEFTDVEHGVEVGAISPPDKGLGGQAILHVGLFNHWRQIYIIESTPWINS